MKYAVKIDHQILTELVERLDAPLVRTCFVIARDRDVAQDAVQNTWQRLWTAPPVLEDESRLQGWLVSVALNEARQMMRHQRRRRIWELSAKNPADVAGDSAHRLDLHAALGRLSLEDRELLALRFLLDLSAAEIGQQLQLSPEGVRSRLHRVILRLRRDTALQGSIGDETPSIAPDRPEGRTPT